MRNVSNWPIATKSAHGLHVGSEGVDRTCQRSGKAVAIDPKLTLAPLYGGFDQSYSASKGGKAFGAPARERSKYFQQLTAVAR
jgi:hypothetical protein